MFNKKLKLEKGVNKKSVLCDLNTSLEIEAGVYNSGALTIFDNNYAQKIELESWRFLLGNGDFLPVCASGVGDFIVYSIENGTFINIETQTMESSTLELSIEDFFNKFLADDGVIDEVLNSEYVAKVRNATGQELEYGETYILVPHSLLGGVDMPQNYQVGDFSVYAEICVQTWQQVKKR